ncbi:hypothetical protein JXA84_05945 [candidate division WOR-3 bacterium]|nr:hypothetical protein [candidate division WOR-3 bacterium]
MKRNFRKIIFSVVGIVVFFLLALGSFENSWGTKITYENGSALYYKSPVTEEEAHSIGKYFQEAGWFDKNTNEKTVQVLKIAGIYQVRFPVKQGYDEDSEYIETCRLMAEEISSYVFFGSPVEVHLCDSNLRTLVVVGTEKIEPDSTLSNDALYGLWAEDQIYLQFSDDDSVKLISRNEHDTIQGVFTLNYGNTMTIKTDDEIIRIHDIRIFSDTLTFKDEADILHTCLRIR